MSINGRHIRDVTDTEGALIFLRERFEKPDYSHDSLSQLVKKGRLRAWIFRGGELVERAQETHTRGKDLLFLYDDLKALAPPKPGRPSKELSEVSEN